jgi:hypothetical protein
MVRLPRPSHRTEWCARSARFPTLELCFVRGIEQSIGDRRHRGGRRHEHVAWFLKTEALLS